MHTHTVLYNVALIYYKITQTCGAVRRPVMSPMVTSSSQAYSKVSLSRGKSLCENSACPRTWRPDSARWPSCKWPCESGRCVLTLQQINTSRMPITCHAISYIPQKFIQSICTSNCWTATNSVDSSQIIITHHNANVLLHYSENYECHLVNYTSITHL